MPRMNLSADEVLTTTRAVRKRLDFDRPVGLFAIVRLERYLQSILGRPVDLVTRPALNPQLRDRILAEAVRAA